jgi:hypothetical protein
MIILGKKPGEALSEEEREQIELRG